jgi:hypothetical protein
MNWEGCRRKRSWHNFRYYINIYHRGLRKTMKNVRVADNPTTTCPQVRSTSYLLRMSHFGI